ncbi:hypothetical protein Agub_g894, partial [Astrephomene gubernaculifera]
MPPLNPAPGEATTAATNRTLVTFQPTPPMSPYLLAVAAGRMRSLSTLVNATTGSSPSPSAPMRVSVWGPAAMDPLLRLSGSLDIAAAAYSYYVSYTGGLPLPLPKLDLLAVPGKRMGMENWGLLMFDTGRFLYPSAPASSSASSPSAWDLFQAADVICHEVAHQWFGNWVTCRDWDNLALNEGVASYIEYDCVAAVLSYILAGGSVTANNSTTAGSAVPLPTYPPSLPLAAPLRRLVVPPLGQPHGVHEGVVTRARWVDEDPGVGSVLKAENAS